MLWMAPFLFPFAAIVASPLIFASMLVAFFFKDRIKANLIVWTCAAPLLVWLVVSAIFAILCDNSYCQSLSFLEKYIFSMAGSEALLSLFGAVVSAGFFYYISSPRKPLTASMNKVMVLFVMPLTVIAGMMAFIALLFAISEFIASQPIYEEGQRAKQANSSDLISAAEKGDLGAQSQLAHDYFYGKGGLKSDSDSFLKWGNIAAERGDPRAQLLLAYYYINTAADYELGVAWARKSAAQEFPRAERFMGYLYGCTDVFERDYDEAMKWWRKGAAHGDSGSMHNIALAYLNGEGVESNESEALRWFRKAADLGNQGSKEMFAQLQFYEEVRIGRFDGDQPWYSLTITSNGSAQFQDYYTRSRKIPIQLTSGQMNLIAEEIRNADFFSIDPHSGMMWFHVPSVDISVVNRGKRHSVTRYGNMIQGQPIWNASRVNDLVLKIEKIAGVEKLVSANPWDFLMSKFKNWPVVGLVLWLLILVSLQLKNKMSENRLKVAALLAAVCFSFLLVAGSGIYVLSLHANPNIPKNCYELSGDGWEPC